MIFQLLISVILIYIGIKGYLTQTYWKRRGVPYHTPWLWLGSFGKTFLGKVTMLDLIQEIYNTAPEAKFLGAMQMSRPMLMIRDPEMIRDICIKSFDSFMNHTVIFTENIDPLFGKTLVSLADQRWRDMRATLSPAFTGSKMRAMHVFMKECAEEFCKHFVEELERNNECTIEMKEVFTRFTNDVIATTAFGIQCNSLKDKDNIFYKTGKEATTFGIWSRIKFTLFFLVPWVMRALKISLLGREVSDFFRNIVKTTMTTRERDGIIRPDMIHLLMEAKKGRLMQEKHDNDAGFATAQETKVINAKKTLLTDDDITAQALLFFMAGYDTSATLMCFLSHELAVNVDVQKKLQSEIDQNFKNGIDYEALSKMKYLDMVVSEALRKWPPAGLTERICTERHVLTDDNVSIVLNKGESVWMPVYSLHHDPKYFPNPDKFDPERFSDENCGGIVPFTYMPFGQGPRNCIASRFALLEVKTLFAYLLSKFDIIVVEKTQIPLRLSKKQFGMQAENGFWLGLKLRN